jgi:uncharacterized membrane protein SpoIIM required for sporulation
MEAAVRPRDDPGAPDIFPPILRVMAALRILAEHWLVLTGLVATFAVAVVACVVRVQAGRDRALDLARRIDKRRKNTAVVYRVLSRPGGALKASMVVFVTNVLAALLWVTADGILLIPPFLYMIVFARYLVMTVALYPERRRLAVAVTPFEAGAFIIAAVAGVNLGVGLFFGDGIQPALDEGVILWLTLVLPLLVVAAILEGFGLHRLYVVQGHPMPEKARVEPR